MMIIIGILLFIIFLFWLGGEKETSGLTLYFANIGTGKTTLLSKLTQEELKRMKKGKSKYDYIVSNACISGVTYIPNIRDILKHSAIAKTLILIDEGSIVYNNRKMNMTEAEIQYYKLIRHYTSKCIVVSQSYDDIDVTLRRLYSSIYLLRWLPFFTLIQPIKKKVGIDETTKQIIDEYQFKNPFTWRLFCRPMYFKYFNSWWIPEDVTIYDLQNIAKFPPQEKVKKSFWFQNLPFIEVTEVKENETD